MKKEDALEIIKRDYHISHDNGKSIGLARSAEHITNFRVWFTDGILTTMRLEAY